MEKVIGSHSDRDSFISSAKQAFSILKDEGLSLDFTGYRQMVEEYRVVDEYDIPRLDRVSRHLSEWIVYFMEIDVFLSFILARLENKSQYLRSFPRQPKVDRALLSLTPRIEAIRQLRQQLRIQIQLFRRFYYHSQTLLTEAQAHLNYRPMIQCED